MPLSRTALRRVMCVALVVWLAPSPGFTQTADAEERSPYRWFILVGFVAGGLLTASRMRARARRRRKERTGDERG